MFDEIAPFYDQFKTHRDYDLEAQTINQLLEGNSESVLEVCCATGSLLQQFQKLGKYVIGIDSSGPMLEVARQKLIGEYQLIAADLEEIDNTTTADSVLFMDGAIGYFEDLTACITKLKTLMNEGSALVIEPWYSKGNWKVDKPFLISSQDEHGNQFIRLSSGREDGSIEFHHLIGNSDGIEHIKGISKFYLHDENDIIKAMEVAGLSPVVLQPEKPFKRGLIVHRPEIQ